jgi:hypothetical protein
MKMHEPEIREDSFIEGYVVVCKKCGKILWYPDGDECKPLPPTLGINIGDNVKTKDKVG